MMAASAIDLDEISASEILDPCQVKGLPFRCEQAGMADRRRKTLGNRGM
jgi:hypothetical protein